MDIQLFESIVVDYKVVFFDAFGVLKNYEGLIPGIESTLQFLDERQIEYYLLTNDASRSPEQLAHSYQEISNGKITEDKIISSGMLAREYLKLKVKHGKVAYLGTENSAHYIETVGLSTISISKLDLSKADEVTALVLLDDEGFDWNHDLNKAINLLRLRNIPVVVANTDDTYPVSKNNVAIAIGGIADMMEDIVGKRFIRFGKPDAQMFIFAHEHISDGELLDKASILMVGDTLFTDIIGGNKFGLDTVLVLSGNTLPHQVNSLVESTGIIPDYICESIVIGG